MTEKQILAALQIESNEVRLVVGEFFNTRLNILKRECVPCKGMDGIRIVDQKAVAGAIREAVNNITAHLGVPVESVLLAIPSYRFKRETRTFSKVIESGDRRVSIDDIRDIYQRALSVNVGSDVEIINVTSTSFRANGIVYRRMPIGEMCDVLEADVDLLCCDKMITYDYAGVVESAGLKIIDVYLDNYSLAKEAALFEQTMRTYMLAIQLEKQHTLFTLIYDGRIVTSENENLGYEALAKPIVEKFNLPERHSTRLLLKYAELDKTSFNDRPMHVWSINQEQRSFTDRQLYETVKDAADSLADEYMNLCGPILDLSAVTVIVAGDGADIAGIDKLFARKFGKQVKCYYPETLGVRSAKMAVCLGMFYAYIDQQEIHAYDTCSVNMEAYQKHINEKVESEVSEEGFTARLKNMLFTNQKNS
ncbi:MAG: hypothetical protein II161_06545 [Erysipelotrichaceae bacterium]|nr:hypothetical protein [Erysipelotrichaceae bacterium]